MERVYEEAFSILELVGRKCRWVVEQGLHGNFQVSFALYEVPPPPLSPPSFFLFFFLPPGLNWARSGMVSLPPS